MWEGLTSAHEECYGDAGGASSHYEEFIANRIKELPVDHLPPPIAGAISDAGRLLRPLPDEDSAKFKDLQRRYNHCGGP